MKRTREGIVKYWLNPARKMKDYSSELFFIGSLKPLFPDVSWLSPAEKAVLRPVLERDANILEHEIVAGDTLQ